MLWQSVLVGISVLALSMPVVVAGTASDSVYAERRESMVNEQIAGRGVDHPDVLRAMRAVPRHRFVPPRYRDYAYIDQPLPIGEDQTISQPYIVALMTQLLDVDSSSRVLEVGTGSGYQAAVLAAMGVRVFSIEIVPSLAARSAAILDTLGYESVSVREGDGYLGWPDAGPFDGIIVTCAPNDVPQPLLEQLADGGRMVIPVGDQRQVLVVLERNGDSITRQEIIPVRFVPMTGLAEDSSSSP